MDCYRGIDDIMALVRGANGLFHAMEPWKLIKQGETDQLNAVLGATMECSRVAGILLQPIIPSFTNRLLSESNVYSFTGSRTADSLIILLIFFFPVFLL